jgi:hypothetical protein
MAQAVQAIGRQTAEGNDMTDKQDAGIVDRLRQAGNDYTIEWGNGDLYDEAADEIEHLRAALAAQPAEAQEPVAWRVRAKTLEQLLTRAIDHVSYGSRRSYDGVGGYKMREAASQLLLEIMAALAALYRAAPPAQPAPAAVPPCHVAVIGHRFDPVNLIHVPQVLLEFEPVPVNSPNDAKGWQDRDALAAMIAAAGDKP